jgi:hypothetical protein
MGKKEKENFEYKQRAEIWKERKKNNSERKRTTYGRLKKRNHLKYT